ncbi:MAG: porin [Verrucomicrobia bacterium]|nr:porin [Verrucomicrobiota bacterium]
MPNSPLARALWCSFLCSLAVTAAAQTSSPGLEERLARLEKQLARLEARLDGTVTATELAPALRELSDLTHQLGWDGKSPLTVVKAGGKEQKLSIGGFVHMQGEFGRATDSRYAGINNRVLLRRARITTKGAFADGFEFTVQPDFGNNSIAGNTAYRGGLADAYVAWTKHEAANVQVGQFKSAFGYEQLLSDTKTPMVERSLPNDLLTVSRQIGVAVLGTVADKRITYNVGAYNGNGVNNGNNDNDQFMYAGRVAATAWSRGADKLSIGTDGYWSNDTGTFSGRRTAWGVDTQLTLGAFDLTGEYLHSIQNRLTGADTTSDGWSAFAGYYLLPKTLQAVVRYETYNANLRVGGNTSSLWTFGANYYVKGDDVKLTFNYVIGDPAGPLSHEGRFMTRLQLVF